MRRFATVSYNMHANFTNYGSALQTYALQRAINEIAPNEVEAIVLDYCPDVLRDLNPLDPVRNMWDPDEESRKMIELSMPAIRENLIKFDRFYHEVCPTSTRSYDSSTFNESLEDECLDGYVCGSDTIFCIREFKGFDDGYYGNYEAMRRSRTVSYAASFGDVDWTGEELAILKKKLGNFKALGLRENTMLAFARENTNVLCERVLDPTLLFKGADYDVITAERQINEPYILQYSRRYNPRMEMYTNAIAEKLGMRVVDINLRATNLAYGHVMRYDAGVEEYLSLIKNAEFLITNSFHGAIFAILEHTPFAVFSREQADTKIDQLLSWVDLSDRKMVTGREPLSFELDFASTDQILEGLRKHSLEYLRTALGIGSEIDESV